MTRWVDGAKPAALALCFLSFGGLPFGDDAHAQGSPAGCRLGSGFAVSQDQGAVTIDCDGVTAAFGDQLAQVLNQIVQNRLDPQAVLAKLDEIEKMPDAGQARTLSESQRQTIIQSLVGKPPQEIAISALKSEDDAGDYAKAIAAPLQMVGWQIQGNQIKRIAPIGFDELTGVAVLVHDQAHPPPKAVVLKTVLESAKIVTPVLSDPTIAPGAAVLWIGRRPSF